MGGSQQYLLFFHKIIPPRIIFINVTLSRKQLIHKSPPSPKKEGFFASKFGSPRGISYIDDIIKNKKAMYKTQLVTTKGDSIRTFISSSRPATRFGSEGVEISYQDSDTSFTIKHCLH